MYHMYVMRQSPLGFVLCVWKWNKLME
jgi:hypothetical protein